MIYGTKADMGCDSVFGIFWKCARIGERLSPYVSICCVVMAVSIFPTLTMGDADELCSQASLMASS